MRDRDTGLSIKKRYYRCKPYHMCFVGKRDLFFYKNWKWWGLTFLVKYRGGSSNMACGEAEAQQPRRGCSNWGGIDVSRNYSSSYRGGSFHRWENVLSVYKGNYSPHHTTHITPHSHCTTPTTPHHTTFTPHHRTAPPHPHRSTPTFIPYHVTPQRHTPHHITPHLH